MKKTLLFLLISVLALTDIYAQSDFQSCIPSDGSTSGNARAPHGRFRYQRGVILITPTEMAASGFVTGDEVNAIAFSYLIAQNVTTDGNLDIYLENTSDVTNAKSATWATAVSTMTLVSTSPVTIPNTAGNIPFTFSGGFTFTYTGSGVYVAFDYQNAANPLPTSFVTVDCNSTGLTGGYKGAQSDTAIPTTLSTSNFRPVILLGKTVSCARPFNFSSSNATINSVELNFTASNSVNLEYGEYGFTPGSGTIITNVTSPYVLSGLNPSTVYDVYAVTDCGGGNLSNVSDVFAFNTVFEPSDVPYTTSFEQESFPFLGWNLENGTPFGSDWQIQTFGPTSVLVQDGATSIYSLSAVTTTPANNWLLSRGINLTAGNEYTISFYARNYVDNGSTGTSSYNVTVGNDQTSTSQTIIGTEVGLSSIAYELKSYTYTPTTSGVHYFGIQNVTPANAVGRVALFIDNLSITGTLANNNFDANKFSVYPNPAANIVNIAGNGINIKAIEITDINGRVVKNVNINGTQTQVNISDLSQGVYMMKISSDEGVAIKKIVKE